MVTRAQKDAEAEATRLAAENAKLTRKLQEAEKNTATFEPSKDELKSVENMVKFVMFSKCQFNVTTADNERITGKIYMKLHTKEQRIADGLEGKNRWIQTFSPKVGTTMGVARGYRCQELRKVCLEHAKENKTLPSLTLIMKCVLGTIDLKDDMEFDVCVWHWTHLAAVTAMGTNWTANIRSYTHMHEAKSQHEATVRMFAPDSVLLGHDLLLTFLLFLPKSDLFTPELKSFLFLMHEN